MIRPGRRLLALTAAVIVPLCAAATLLPQWLSLWLLLALVIAVLLFVDAGRGVSAARNVSVSAPPLLKLTKGRAATMDFAVNNMGKRGLSGRFAITLPFEVSSACAEGLLSVPVHGRSVQRLDLTANRRGHLSLGSCHLQFASPLRLWLSQRTLPLDCQLQVYPNLARNRVAAAVLSHKHLGLKLHRQRGKGRDFEKLREYSAGDAFDEVHWKASARRGRPIVKVFQVERAQQLYVLIDTSRHSGRSETLDHFVESALVLGLAAERAGDQFGVATFSDRVHKFLRARSGKTHYTECRNAIYDVQAAPVSADFAELATFLMSNLRKRAMLLLLTNLDDPYIAESLALQLRMLTRRHLVVVASIGQSFSHPIFEGPEPQSVEDVYSAVAGHQLWQRTQELSQVFRRHGAQLLVCTPENIHRQLTDQYLKAKQRQAL